MLDQAVRLARGTELLIRFAGVGVLNAAFGFGLYALLVRLGVNVFAAQISSHLLGMAFNYVMFKRHVFRDANHALFRFCVAYAMNYGLSLALMAALRPFIASPYLLGLVTLSGVAVLNFLILRFAVFRRRSEP